MTAGTLAAGWLERLRGELRGYATVAMDNIAREFPSGVYTVMTAPGDFPDRPRERTPVFFGSFDWHSCVEMHWLLVRLLREAPGTIAEAEVRAVLDRQFTVDGLRAEAAYMRTEHGATMQRPYGWGWALNLADQLESWDDPDGRRWARAFAPLAGALAENFLGWLPRATYPLRSGQHTNSAFGISRALPYARRLASAGQPELAEAMTGAARRWYLADADYPGGWEPSGHDFLSPALAEAELLTLLLSPDEFADWLTRFMPGIADGEPKALFTPAVVSDSSDGYIAHLRGLNLSRAWCWRRLAEALPRGDRRVPVCERAARTHAEASLRYVTGDHYMVGHWLAAYAVLLFS